MWLLLLMLEKQKNTGIPEKRLRLQKVGKERFFFSD